MNISNFKAGKLQHRYQYKSFEPNLIDSFWLIDNAELIMLLSDATIKLGELNAFSQLIPDVDFFIKMMVTKEGTKSSRIEGTQTNIDEALQKESYIDPETKDDWNEVQNYIKAMSQAIESLERLPLSNRLLKETHKTLLQGVRGKNKLPGEFRHSQNWIGGISLADAYYIPPHHESISDLMADLEKFLNNFNSQIPPLIKIGMAHYQFESIHPFLDGNGRVGRLLIPLYLVSNGTLNQPTLYISDFFEKNKTLYYDNLTRVRTHNDMTHWLKFFLEGIRSTSESSIQTFKSIIELRKDVEHQIISFGKQQALAKKFLFYLYAKPITDAIDVSGELEISVATSFRLINRFVELNILKEITGFKRNRLFAFDKYIKLFR